MVFIIFLYIYNIYILFPCYTEEESTYTIFISDYRIFFRGFYVIIWIFLWITWHTYMVVAPVHMQLSTPTDPNTHICHMICIFYNFFCGSFFVFLCFIIFLGICFVQLLRRVLELLHYNREVYVHIVLLLIMVLQYMYGNVQLEL